MTLILPGELRQVSASGSGGVPWRARGLVALFDIARARELINGVVASSNTTTREVGRGGVSGDFSGTIRQQYPHHPAFALTTAWSLAVYCDVDALSNYSSIYAKQSSPTENGIEIRLGSGSTDSHILVHRSNAGGFAQYSTGANRITAGDKGVLLVITEPSGSVNDAGGFVYVNGVKSAASTSVGGGGTGTISDIGSDVWIGRRSDGSTQLDGKIYYVALFRRSLDEGEVRELSRNPRQLLFRPEPTWPFSATGAASHDATGALAADAATLAGTATHLTLHTTSGALSADAATVAGTATHLTLHTTTGALAADAATVAGAAVHPHTTTGALSADAATVAGTAAHLTLHTTTGALAADAAAVAGSAAHTVPGASHDTDGALSADAATVAGTATHLTLHSTTGALAADAATVSGAAVHGSGTTISVVQPYITVYFWKRAA